MKKGRFVPARNLPHQQLDSILASLNNQLAIVSCANVLDNLSHKGVLECLLRQTGVSQVLQAKSLVDGDEVSVLFLRIPDCINPICVLTAPQDLLVVAANAAELNRAEIMLRMSCSVAIRAAVRLYNSWLDGLHALEKDSRPLSDAQLEEAYNRLRKAHDLPEWEWGSESFRDTIIGSSAARARRVALLLANNSQ